MGKKRVSVREALALVPDNMGDMAQVALAAEMAGVDFADAFLDIADGPRSVGPIPTGSAKRDLANDRLRRLKRAGFEVKQFVDTHWRINGKVDYWPTTDRWKFLDGSAKGFYIEQMMKALRALEKRGRARGFRDRKRLCNPDANLHSGIYGTRPEHADGELK